MVTAGGDEDGKSEVGDGMGKSVIFSLCRPHGDQFKLAAVQQFELRVSRRAAVLCL